ncbi:MAG: cytidylate kinase-like family protein [Spirochaetota bacterium]
MNVITVSRSYGSAGTSFASKLAEVMGYRYVGEELVKKIDESKDVSDVLAMNLEAETPPDFFKKMKELVSNRNFFKVALETYVYEMALQDNLVFVGGGVHLILEGYPCLFSVQIVRGLSDRVRAVAADEKIKCDVALELVKKIDKHKVNFIKHYFDKELFDPTMFHLTINSSRMTLDDGLDMIAEYSEKAFKRADHNNSKLFLTKRLIEKRSQLILFALNLTHQGKINFEAKDDGKLVIKGVIGGKNDKERLLGMLSKVPGVTGVEDNLTVGILSRNLY